MKNIFLFLAVFVAATGSDFAAGAGWRGAGRWSDPADDLSLHLLVTADS